MKTKLLTLILLLCTALALTAAFCACETKSDSDKDSDETTSAVAESTAESTVESAEETTEAAINGYKVTVVNQNNEPVADVYVQMCVGESCMLPMPTDANGVIIFEYDENDYTVKATDYSGTYVPEQAEYTFADGSKELVIKMKPAN